MSFFKGLAVFALLLFNSITDLKKHEVWIPSLIIAGFAAPAVNPASGTSSPAEIFSGIIPGAFIIAVSFLSRGEVGAGDGLLLMAVGLLLGIESTISLLFTGALLCASVSAVGLSAKWLRRKDALPFVPFILCAYLWRIFFMIFKKQNWKTGSFTVEASILIPFMILIIFVFICLCLYLHDRSVLSACASEISGKSAAQKYETTDHLEAWTVEEAESLVEGRLFILKNISVSAEVSSSEVTVTYSGSSPLLHGISTTEQETASRENPVEAIKSTINLTDLAGDLTGTATDGLSE